MSFFKLRIKNKTSERLFVASILAYPLLMFTIFWLGVNLNSIILAFQKVDFFNNKTFAGLSNFKEFIVQLTANDSPISIAFTNSIKRYVLNTIICVPLYILFAYLLFKQFKGHKIIRLIVMVPTIVSGMIIALIFGKFVDQALPAIAEQYFGAKDFPTLLYDKRYSFGLMIFYDIWVSFSVSLIIYPNAMKEISPSIFDSAKIDGVTSMFHELWYIILPLIYPTFTTLFVTGFAGLLSNGGNILTFYMYSAPSYVYNMGYYYTLMVKISDNIMGWPVLSAGGIIMTLLVAPLTYLLKYLMEKHGPTCEY